MPRRYILIWIMTISNTAMNNIWTRLTPSKLILVELKLKSAERLTGEVYLKSLLSDGNCPVSTALTFIVNPNSIYGGSSLSHQFQQLLLLVYFQYLPEKARTTIQKL
jgi:hypothetical protein